MGTGTDLWHQFEALLKERDLAGASSFTSDGVHVAPIGRREGREAIGAFWEEMRKGVSEINMTTSLVLEDGGTVVAEWSYRATATGITRELAGVTLATVRDGKFAAMRDYYDTANANELTPVDP